MTATMTQTADTQSTLLNPAPASPSAVLQETMTTTGAFLENLGRLLKEGKAGDALALCGKIKDALKADTREEAKGGTLGNAPASPVSSGDPNEKPKAAKVPYADEHEEEIECSDFSPKARHTMAQIGRLRDYLVTQEAQKVSCPPGGVYRFVFGPWTVTAYKSGKITAQGVDVFDFVEDHLGPKVMDV